ncbi:hypothetical protein K474DRAFT_1591654 [Panus rudis PR-1116 ss-1]|nr:hypothetical protein K474DRAFT_1591654 [Panus rudis PR-1116 ss-1]
MLQSGVPVFRREPTAEEVAVAESEIATHELAVSRLQSQIQTLQRQIDTLKVSQAEHRRVIGRFRGITTLARRIPSELLACIFEQCVKNGWYRAPLVVSHVCSQWREAARAPRVWSRIYVNMDDAKAIERTRFWLMMASHAPLHITLAATWRVVPAQILDCARLLLNHASDWETLNLDTRIVQHVKLIILCIMQSHVALPKLKRIEVTTEMQFDPELDGMDGETVTSADAFSADRAPNLTSISLRTNALPPSIKFPAHLCRLELTISDSPSSRHLRASSLLDVLESLSCLKYLSISMPLEYERPYEDDAGMRIVELPELSALFLYGPTDINGFLTHLYAPALRRLHLRSLEDRGYRQNPIGPSLLEFIRNTSSHTSYSPIEVLELYDIDLPPEHFAACFTSLPNLCELRLHESSISEATLRLLQTSGGSLTYQGGLCPKLTKLDLRWCGHLPGSALVALVQSRMVDHSQVKLAPSPITEVTVLNCCFVEEQDVIELSKMTQCRVVVRPSDYCYSRRCCENIRYRQRLWLRHLSSLPPEERARYRLIV